MGKFTKTLLKDKAVVFDLLFIFLQPLYYEKYIEPTKGMGHK